jgi:hypothetical protein
MKDYTVEATCSVGSGGTFQIEFTTSAESVRLLKRRLRDGDVDCQMGIPGPGDPIHFAIVSAKAVPIK